MKTRTRRLILPILALIVCLVFLVNKLVPVVVNDIKSSEFTCLAAGERRAYCEATNVCVHRDYGVFLLSANSEDQRDPVSFNIRDMRKISPPNYPSASNMVMADPDDSVFVGPPIVNSMDPDKMIFFPGETLYLSGSYASYHYTHYIFNSLLPLWNVRFGDAIENLMNYVDATKNDSARMYFAPDDNGEIWHKAKRPYRQHHTWMPSSRAPNKPFPGEKAPTNFGLGSTERSAFEPFIMLEPGDRIFLFSDSKVSKLITRNTSITRNTLITRNTSNQNQTPYVSLYNHDGVRNLTFEAGNAFCYERATFGPAGACGYNCPESLDPVAVGKFSDRLSRKAMALFNNKTRHNDNRLKLDNFLSKLLIKPSFSTCNNNDHKKVVISVTFIQRLKGARQILNMDEGWPLILDALSQFTLSHGQLCIEARLLQFDKANVVEQIVAIQKTNILIAVHGNSLGNFIFLPYQSAIKTSIIEVFPPRYDTDFFESLILSLAPRNFLKYLSYRCKKDCYYEGKDGKNDNFNVTWPDLLPLLRESLNHVIS